MIEQLTDLPEGIIGLRASGQVTQQDYEEVVRPLLDEAHAAGRRIRLLYHFPPEFERFSAGAAWEDARLGLRHLRLFERCAIVSDREWIRNASRLIGTMLPCAVRVFAEADRDRAIEWLGSPDGARVPHLLFPAKGLLVIEPEDRLRVEDFDVVALTVDPWIETHGELRGLVVRARELPGWENLGSFLRHLRFVRNHHRKIHRVALVSDARLAKILPKLAGHFVEAELKHFDHDQFEEAMAWASDEASPARSERAGRV